MYLVIVDVFFNKFVFFIELGDLVKVEVVVVILVIFFLIFQYGFWVFSNVGCNVMGVGYYEQVECVYCKLISDFFGDCMVKSVQVQLQFFQMFGKMVFELDIIEWMGEDFDSVVVLCGKNVMFVFWVIWCFVCCKIIFSIQEFYECNKSFDFEMILVICYFKGQISEKVCDYIVEKGLMMFVVVDLGVGQCNYGVLGIFSVVFIDKKGKVVFWDYLICFIDVVFVKYKQQFGVLLIVEVVLVCSQWE